MEAITNGQVQPGPVAALEDAVNTLQAQHVALSDQLATVSEQLRRHKRALSTLVDEPGPKRQKPGPKSKPGRPSSRLANETLAELEEAIRAYAVDHDEFRQVDIRNANGWSSSTSGTPTGGRRAR